VTSSPIALPKWPSRAVALTGLGLLLAGCGGGLFGSESPAVTDPAGTSSSALGNLMRFGTTSPPPVLEIPEDEIACPPVLIAPGGAALRIGGGASESVRSQITITDVARECARAPGGGITMRVGAEGRVLVGPAGSSGALGATMRIDVRRGDTLLSSRNVRIGATVPSGEAQASWVHVEPGIAVPAAALAGTADVDVFVTLNPGAPARRRR
jgi:hypothetical protein